MVEDNYQTKKLQTHNNIILCVTDKYRHKISNKWEHIKNE